MVEKIPPIDPTKNVLDLVRAESAHRDSLRDADNRFQNAMREAETRRLNELAAQKLTFDFEMSRVLRANQDATATLISTSLQEVKNDLSERMSKQEQFRWESGGKQQGIGSLAATAFSVISLAIALGSLGFMVARHQ